MSHVFFLEKRRQLPLIRMKRVGQSRNCPLTATCFTQLWLSENRLTCVLLLQAHWCFSSTLAAERRGKQNLFVLCKCWLATVNVPLMWFLLLDLLLSADMEKNRKGSSALMQACVIWILCIRVAKANKTTERGDNCMWLQNNINNYNNNNNNKTYYGNEKFWWHLFTLSLVFFMQGNFTQICTCVYCVLSSFSFWKVHSLLPPSTVHFPTCKYLRIETISLFKKLHLQLLTLQYRLHKSTPETQCQLNTFSSSKTCWMQRTRYIKASCLSDLKGSSSFSPLEVRRGIFPPPPVWRELL